MSKVLPRLAVLGICLLGAPLLAAAAPFDVLIVNGRIVDGTGSPWYSGSVAIKDGKIVAILPAGVVVVEAKAGPSLRLKNACVQDDGP